MYYLKKYVTSLLILEVIILLAGYFISVKYDSTPEFTEILSLSALFLGNNALILFIFFRGQTREPESQTMHSLVAVSLKFIVELGIALVWFLIAKKTEMQSVLLFFVLYLSFTLFSILMILKTLKYKSL